MNAGEDHPHAARDAHPAPSVAPLRGAALAAELLENSCAPGSGDPLRLEVVRGLAKDLKGELEALAVLVEREADTAYIEGIEGALRASEVANLAACAVPELLEPHALEATAATHLATGAVRALDALIEADSEGATGDREQNALRDVRSAVWRARLAARQVGAFLGEAD
jgi:hypothetical protein